MDGRAVNRECNGLPDAGIFDGRAPALENQRDRVSGGGRPDLHSALLDGAHVGRGDFDKLRLPQLQVQHLVARGASHLDRYPVQEGPPAPVVFVCGQRQPPSRL